MDTLIINLRHELPLRKRILSDAATAFLWAFWIYLWWPFFEILWRIVIIHASAEDIADTIFDEIHAVTVEHALMMLIGTSAILILIAKLPKYRPQSLHAVYQPEEYAQFFAIHPDELVQGLQSQVCTLHHNASGKIVSIQTGVPNNAVKASAPVS